MRKFIVIAGLLIIAGSVYYFAPGSEWGVRSDSGKVSSEAWNVDNFGAGREGMVLGTEAVKEATRSVSGSVYDFLNDAVQGVILGAKGTVVDEVARFLGVVSSSPNPGFGVCPVYGRNERIAYLLEFPSSSASGVYVVEWGDGSASEGSGISAPGGFPISHSYAAPGTYKILFKAGISGPVLAEKVICVE